LSGGRVVGGGERELHLNPSQAIRTQQQRQFSGVGQIVVEETQSGS